MAIGARRGLPQVLARLQVDIGQSNKAGLSSFSDLPGYLTTPDTGIKTWTQLGFVTLENGVNNDNLDYPAPGYPASDHFGSEANRTYLLRQAEPTRPIFDIKHAFGGIPLSSAIGDGNGGTGTFDPAIISPANYFAQTTAMVIAAKAAIGVPVQVEAFFTGMEQDALFALSADAAAVNIPAFIAAMQSEWGATRIIITRTRASFTYSAAVRAAQDAAASSIVKVIDTDDLALSDGVHFTPASLITLGAREAALVA